MPAGSAGVLVCLFRRVTLGRLQCPSDMSALVGTLQLPEQFKCFLALSIAKRPHQVASIGPRGIEHRSVDRVYRFELAFLQAIEQSRRKLVSSLFDQAQTVATLRVGLRSFGPVLPKRRVVRDESDRYEVFVLLYELRGCISWTQQADANVASPRCQVLPQVLSCTSESCRVSPTGNV